MDYYQILGVDRSASMDEIKKAYRKLAAIHHPDRGGDAEKFKEIQVAYDILGHPERRHTYDNPAPGDNFFRWHNPSMEDIFAHFGQGGGGEAFNPFDLFGRQRHVQKNKNINVHAEITLEEAFYGKDLIFNVQLPSGRTQTVNIKVPQGVNSGTVLRISGLGDDAIPNIPRGDIHLTIGISGHPEFARQGDDLVKELPIHCVDAILGTKVTINTIDGKTLEVTINPGMQHGQVLSSAGYGMPNMQDPRFRGRLLMPIKILIPSVISQGQRELLEKYHQA